MVEVLLGLAGDITGEIGNGAFSGHLVPKVPVKNRFLTLLCLKVAHLK